MTSDWGQSYFPRDNDMGSSINDVMPEGGRGGSGLHD